ncbi:sigma-70 family RNA polymerase sigma factor [Robertmurraya sp. DFI.2.37]|uniref:sigma-70 family RNA polymerase sigma factor n=1 Tax=Robertmurraya sp. DFI.2.37 TaxID=3031819 RepID=UPI001248C015|nr:sigma-70 family RNA polymerase sigma factor [Robertmurraya sp. DFI.2.37]MDF1507641.1 sigma-70 family RNA polymerase sigma factor [Robertmurraya sp. DFI.2.37]
MLVAEQVPTVEELVKENERLVHYVVKRYIKRGKMLNIDYDDLVSEGMIGLLKAIERFDESYGVKFSTYAVPMIQGNIQRFLRDINPGAKYPRKIKEIANKLNGDESVEEICDLFGVTEELAKDVLGFKRNSYAVSLNKPTGDDEGKQTTIEDLVPSEDDFSSVYVEEFFNVLDDEKLKTIVNGVMSGKTQSEIGQEIGVSQVQVSRLLKNIQQKYLDFEKGELVVKKANITEKNYLDLKSQGLKDKEICEKFSISLATLYNYKKTWKQSQPEVKIKTSDKENELHLLIKQLKEKLEKKEIEGTEKDTLISKLEAKIKELEGIGSACDDVEYELNSVVEEREELQKQVCLNSYTIENQKKRISDLGKTLEKYEEENRVLRKLVALWA